MQRKELLLKKGETRIPRINANRRWSVIYLL